MCQFIGNILLYKFQLEKLFKGNNRSLLCCLFIYKYKFKNVILWSVKDIHQESVSYVWQEICSQLTILIFKQFQVITFQTTFHVKFYRQQLRIPLKLFTKFSNLFLLKKLYIHLYFKNVISIHLYFNTWVRRFKPLGIT